MVETLVIALTCIPILAGVLAGLRIGGPRLIAIGLPLLLAWTAGIWTARLGLEAGWFEPFGLVTPACLGIAAAIIARRLASRLLAGRGPTAFPRQATGSGVTRAATGAALGLGFGVAAAASIWMAASLVDGMSSPRDDGPSKEPGAKKDGLIHALVRTANHGFVRHLPLVGGLGDEVEALSFIMSRRPETRARLALELGWEKLADLPSFRAIMKDHRTVADIDLAGEGDIAALYRLQKNDLILAFFREEEVREIISGTRPSTLARGLAEIEAAGATTASSALPETR